jgi:predicted kinase
MAQSTLIIITGMAATGKTTLSQKLASDLRWPLINKDTVMEIIFDQLGWEDRQRSIRTGITAYRLMDYVIEEQLKAGHNLIVESNFKPSFDSRRFSEWIKKYDVTCLQIVCHADKDIILKRYADRQHKRHQGHVVNVGTQTYRAEYDDRVAAGESSPLDIPARTLQIDTTKPEAIDMATIHQHIKQKVRS